MFCKLRSRGFINYRKYEDVALTQKGEELAKNVSEVHENVKKFLEFLQVTPDQAGEDACKAEHSLSQESITRLNKFIDFVEAVPEGQVQWWQSFIYFASHNELQPEDGPAEEEDKG